MERFNGRKINEMEFIEQYQFISRRSAGLETWMGAGTFTGLGKITGNVSKSPTRQSRSVQK
jgi:hypothetical protein